jgi:hypothetical protein
MSEPRPQISPLLLAQMIESMPGRVRKRLDAEPNVAQGWQWSFAENRWLVAAGEETVELRGENGVLTSHEHLQCSCLLTPKCFHVVACISILSAVMTSEPEAHDATDSENVKPTAESSEPLIPITDEMREAAISARCSIAAVLRVGATRSGLLVQSSVLRAAHQCRETGLITLGNTLLRIVEGSGRLRTNRDTTDSNALRDDIASALANALAIEKQEFAPKWLVGQARRTFESVEVRKLEGLCAEPILTLSGYAGVCVYLQAMGPTGEELFTVNELRPGDSQLVLQAYGGGIDLGTVAVEARRLVRSSLAVQNLQSSSDGRLGKGKSTRWAVQSMRTDPKAFRAGRFGLPLEAQIEQVFKRSLLSESQRHGGWDFVAFDAVVVGAQGASVLVAVEQLNQPWRLMIAIDDAELPFRENLALLARCPGLALRCLGRLRLAIAGEVELIAIASGDSPQTHGVSKGEPPTLNLPTPWEGVCNVGVDRLEQRYIHGIQRWSEEVPVESESLGPKVATDGLESLRRRLTGIALGGRVAVPALGSSTHRREQRILEQSYQSTAAQLLELLAISAGRSEAKLRSDFGRESCAACRLEDAYLASWSYLQAAVLHFEAKSWQRGFA